MRNWIDGSFYVVAFLFALIAPANAGLLLSPSTGTIIYQGGSASSGNGIEVRNTPSTDYVFGIDAWSGFTGHHFGTNPIPSAGKIWVSENGNINFSANNSFFPLDTTRIARISPLWDDFLFAPFSTNQIVIHTNPGSYIAATWENVRTAFDEPGGPEGMGFPDSNRSAQVVWFEGDTTINGFEFKRNELAFSYIGHVAGTADFGAIESFVGLENGAGLQIFAPGADSSGIIKNGNALPWQEGSFFVIRPTSVDGVASYSITAVPEPGTLCMVGCFFGAIAMFRFVWTRGRGTKAHDFRL
jgi:hypothetical protein